MDDVACLIAPRVTKLPRRQVAPHEDAVLTALFFHVLMSDS